MSRWILALLASVGLAPIAMADEMVTYYWVPRDIWRTNPMYHVNAPAPYLAGGPIYTYHVTPYTPTAAPAPIIWQHRPLPTSPVRAADPARGGPFGTVTPFR